jgi:hypothetical protein
LLPVKRNQPILQAVQPVLSVPTRLNLLQPDSTPLVWAFLMVQMPLSIDLVASIIFKAIIRQHIIRPTDVIIRFEMAAEAYQTACIKQQKTALQLPLPVRYKDILMD